MQLLGVFALLYLLEGVLFGTPGCVLFRAARKQWLARRFDGPTLLPWRPGCVALLAAPLPFRVDADAVTSDVALRRFGTRDPGETGPRISTFDDARDATAKGSMLRAGGRRFARAASAEHAASAAALLHALGHATAAQRGDVTRAWERETSDVAALRAHVDAARRGVRWLGIVCDAYLAALFALLPISIAAIDETIALLALLPLVAALHVVALVLAWRAHRSLCPDARSDRVETLLAAALFPPHLLRLPQRIFLAAVGAPRPEAAAATLLAGEARLGSLRRALAEAEHGGGASASVLDIAARAGIEETELRRRPTRVDAASAAYCPVCFAEYRAGFETCADCRVRLVPHGA